MPQPPKDRFLLLWPLFAALAAGLTLRTMLVAQFSRLPLFRHPLLDSLLYHQQAVDIAGGKLAGDQAFFFGPLYPYLLGLCYTLFGPGELVPRGMNIVLELVTISLVFFLARRCFGPAAAIIASAAYALYLPAIFFTGLPLMAPLVTTLFTMLALLLAIAATDKPSSARWWFLAGLALGLGCLARANLLVLAPLFLLLLHRHQRDRFWKLSGLFVLGVVLLILPATLHNARAEGQLIPLTTNLGLNFYVGNNDQASGRYMLPPGLDAQNDPRGRRFAEQATGREMGSRQLSGFYLSRGLDFVADQPGTALVLLLKKFRLFWHFFEIPQIYNYTLLKESLPLLRAPLPSFLIVSPLALVGIGLVLVRRKDPARLLAAAAGLYILSLLPFFITGRYRLPLVPLLIVFSACTVTTLVQSARSRNYKTLGIIVALLLVLPLTFTGFRQQVQPFERSQFFNSIGLACRSAGDTAGAEASFRRALQDDPRNPFILANLGQLLAQRGDDAGAVNCYDRALQQNPGSTELLFLQVQACARAGEVDKAMESCRRLLEIDPDFFQASFGLVGFHLSKGEPAEAAAAFRDYARSKPDDLQSRFNLTDHLVAVGQLDLAGELLTEGLALAPDAAPLHGRLGDVRLRQGRPAEARQHLEEALRLDPNHEPAQVLMQRIEEGK